MTINLLSAYNVYGYVGSMLTETLNFAIIMDVIDNISHYQYYSPNGRMGKWQPVFLAADGLSSSIWMLFKEDGFDVSED